MMGRASIIGAAMAAAWVGCGDTTTTTVVGEAFDWAPLALCVGAGDACEAGDAARLAPDTAGGASAVSATLANGSAEAIAVTGVQLYEDAAVEAPDLVAVALSGDVALPFTLGPGDSLTVTVTLSAGAAPGALPVDALDLALQRVDAPSERFTRRLWLVGEVPGCAVGTDSCDDDWSNGCEADLDVDAEHCGACARACEVAHGAATCSLGECVPACADGYQGAACDVDVDECADGSAGCDANATCTNSPGGFACACDSGFAGDGVSCTDVDECATDNGGCADDVPCVNLPGGSACECAPGYIDDDGGCVDLNECVYQLDDCDPNADCTNTDGGYVCACRVGFEGDGESCVDVDECAIDNGGCGDATYATCTNVAGGAAICGDIDECATDNGGCGADATCKNLVGGPPRCSCPAGWVGDGVTCSDPCATGTVLERLDAGCRELSGEDLAGLDLSGYELSGLRAVGVAACPDELPASWACIDAGAAGSCLVGAGASLAGASLVGADLAGVTLVDADLTGADLSDARLTGARLSGALFTDTILDGLEALELVAGCPLELPGGWRCHAQPATGDDFLAGPGGVLSGGDLGYADLVGLDLSAAVFASADLSYADLTDTTLTGADLTGADLTGASLAGADLSDVDWTDATCPDGAVAATSCCDQLNGATPTAGCP